VRATWSGVGVFAVAGLLLAACGGGDDGEATTVTSTASSTAAATTVASAGGDGRVTSVQDVKSATVQVLAQGSFRDPAEGTVGTSGSGSGFIIDPRGIIVTNNHVVTGAGAIQVLIGGDDEEVPAKILGVSECNDLAVIQLTDPGPYPYLTWFDGDVNPPLEVYAAGFPLGDPEFTATRGVVSKAQADGDTSWASIRNVIEHDANIQPGNSGGPLVNEAGEVVAVNYAGGDPGTGTSQFFAIAADLAAPIVETLKKGDAETIGVNGEAIITEDGLAGVWVGGVAAGSPAAKAGVMPGDVITTLNGVAIDTGTMKPYCDVLRTAQEGDAIAIQVIRFDTQEVWEGELNGTPMVARFSFAEALGDEVEEGGSADGSSTYSYESITDETGTITVSVPVEWADRVLSPQDIGIDAPVPAIQAAPDLAAFTNTNEAPGMVFLAVPSGANEVDPNAVLDNFAPDACEDLGRDDYADAVFAGRQQVWSCGASLVVVLSVKPAGNPDVLVVVAMQAQTEADLEALDNIILTFNLA
jgi:serine protease Do